MNNLLRSAFKMCNYRSLLTPATKALYITNCIQQRQLARNLWYLSNGDHTKYEHKLSKLCTCGCLNHSQQVHSRAERELVEFLTEEIVAERKARQSNTLPAEVDGFKVKLDGAEVTFIKELENEKIVIGFNVNHSVDIDAEPEISPNQDKPELGELESKPAFKVEIVRGKTTLRLLCSFITSSQQEQEEGYIDVFELDELSIYDGEWNENVYAISGEAVDSYLYDLILNYLEEKGISNEFVEKLSKFSTAYEHSAYIGLLEGLSKFASGK